ncbi:MAG: hypothetical protein SGCHY_004698, partial [Lobulomycetales sp.]
MEVKAIISIAETVSSSVLCCFMTFLLYSKTRGTWANIKSWGETKQYYVGLLGLSMIFIGLVTAVVFVQNESVKLGVGIPSLLALVAISNLFVAYCLFCYCRLASILK